MIGERVVVHRTAMVGKNAHNQPIYETAEENVDNVLVAPGPRTDIPEVARPDGTTVAWSLHFPKSYVQSLRGARISVRGEAPARVIGDPKSYTPENTPGDWNLPVEVERADG